MTAFRGAITLLFAAFSGVAPTFATAETSYRLLEFRELDGWELDEHQEALEAFLNTCTDLDAETWGPLCALAQQGPEAKAYFELRALNRLCVRLTRSGQKPNEKQD